MSSNPAYRDAHQPEEEAFPAPEEGQAIDFGEPPIEEQKESVEVFSADEEQKQSEDQPAATSDKLSAKDASARDQSAREPSEAAGEGVEVRNSMEI